MFRQKLKWILLSIGCGVVAGLSAAAFLHVLDIATNYREGHAWIIWLLPIAGLVIGLAYHFYGQEAEAGNNLIIEEIHDPKKTVPARMAPMILLGTVLTHLFGGSAGREGTAVQMGASLSDQLGRIFQVSSQERRILLVAGAGAGFGAAIGAPWAGVIFGMEMIQVGKLKLFAFIECLIASFVGYYVVILLQAPHSQFSHVIVDLFSWKLLLSVVILGILSGFIARFFCMLTHQVHEFHKRFVPWKFLRPMVAGLVLVLMYQMEGSYQYDGLGIDVIQKYFFTPSGFEVPFFKSFFTAITVGSGFKGGEFVPLVFVGSTFGSAMSQFLPVSIGLLSALGFAAVFAGASNAPLSCAIMAMELFGPGVGVYALIACFMSYYFSGHPGIYSSQKLARDKIHFLSKFLPRRKS